MLAQDSRLKGLHQGSEVNQLLMKVSHLDVGLELFFLMSMYP